MMDLRYLTSDYAVAPQISADMVKEIAKAGFRRVICNRPDGEIPGDLRAARIAEAVAAHGMQFVDNPIMPGALTQQNVAVQAQAIKDAGGPVLAYCASGNRSTIVWALAEAGKIPTDEMIATARRWGYDLAPYRDRIEASAAV